MKFENNSFINLEEFQLLTSHCCHNLITMITDLKCGYLVRTARKKLRKSYPLIRKLAVAQKENMLLQISSSFQTHIRIQKTSVPTL